MKNCLHKLREKRLYNLLNGSVKPYGRKLTVVLLWLLMLYFIPLWLYHLYVTPMILVQLFIHILKKEDNHDSATHTTYKRKIFGRQKTLSETSIYNPIDPQEQKKSRQNSFADKTLDCITQCFWQCSSCYQCNEKS